MRWLTTRSTSEMLVIIITGTICLVVVFTGAATAVYAFLNPGNSIDGPARLIADIMNTLIGLLAGFLAGSTATTLNRRPQENNAVPPDV